MLLQRDQLPMILSGGMGGRVMRSGSSVMVRSGGVEGSFFQRSKRLQSPRITGARETKEPTWQALGRAPPARCQIVATLTPSIWSATWQAGSLPLRPIWNFHLFCQLKPVVSALESEGLPRRPAADPCTPRFNAWS